MIEDYVRNAEMVKVVDGDTVDLAVDLGFRIWMTCRVRLLHVDCPEMTGSTKAAGLAAKAFTTKWLDVNKPIQIRTVLDVRDSFGRVLAVVCSGDRCLNDELIESGNAVRGR